MTDVFCSSCGQAHPLGEIEGSFFRPDAVARMGLLARLLRVRDDGVSCVIRGRARFVRGLLCFRVVGLDQDYCWGIWAQVDKDAFVDIERRWDRSDRENGPVHAATIANELPVFGQPMLGLRVSVVVQPRGTAPHVRIEDPGHPAFREQREGISPGRAMAFNHFVLGLGT